MLSINMTFPADYNAEAQNKSIRFRKEITF